MIAEASSATAEEIGSAGQPPFPGVAAGGLEGHSRPLLCAPLSSAIPSLLPLLDLAAVGGPLGTPVLASDSCRLCEFGRSQVSQMVAVEIGDERGWLIAREPWEAGVWV